jgi:hypothetical protein
VTGGAVRWVLALAVGLVLIALVVYARGPEHHRGDDIGALSAFHSTEVGS